MPTIDPNYVSQLAAAAVVALAAIAFGLQTLMKNWKSNNAENSLLKMMHEELERMSTQNTILSSEIGKLQLELIKLSTQLSNLSSENHKLQVEVATLHKEIARLHGIMQTGV
jgi:predicted nuclease with TOPRIM domain